jgi:Secretion system C-terminal sorting domain
MKIKKTASFLLFGASVSLAHAQQSVDASGGNVSSAGGSVSYSVGQVVYQNYINANGSVEQGVQHAYEIVTAGISQNKISYSVSVFPNPTVDALNLSIEKLEGNMEYQLFSETGQLIEVKSVQDLITVIDAKDLAPGIYLLNLLSNQEQVESFRIIKK